MAEVSKTVLREERLDGDYRYLGIEQKANGDLVFEGQDLGPGVEQAMGTREYEWTWTIKAQHVLALKQALGADGEILSVLKQHFANDKAAGLYNFLNTHQIPVETWSRSGD